MSQEARTESAKAAEAFTHYCALGSGRSLVKLLPILGKENGYLRQLERWSREFDWQERVKQYDAQRNREKLQRSEELLQQMEERHVQIALSLQLKMVKLIEKLDKDEQIDARTAAQLLKYATDLERLARGAAIEHHIELTGKDGGPVEYSSDARNINIDLSKLTTAQIDKLLAILEDDQEEEIPLEED